MSSLQGKHILVGVCGGIAAYKSILLIRHLQQKGAVVRVALTPTAHRFVSADTIGALTDHKVYHTFTDAEHKWNNHIHLTEWADAFIVAPLTASTLARFAHGLADHFVAACYLSCRCPMWFAPAMDRDMYLHQTTQKNIKTLATLPDHYIINPQEGYLASGLYGIGRVAEPEQIVEEVEEYFTAANTLQGEKVMITAGATREPIDPVRYISNHSTGKMGFALAKEAMRMGASVTLIVGHTTQTPPQTHQLIRVSTADEMYKECMEQYQKQDIIVMNAAVADYTPAAPSSQKIKKKGKTEQIALTPTTDILKEMGQKKTTQFIVGFALETENEVANAQKKRKEKNADMIILNSLSEDGAGYGVDTNRVHIITEEEIISPPLDSKENIAKEIMGTIEKNFCSETEKSNTNHAS